ncbi:MAG TPA: hypothetical protein VFV05_14970 [Methylomirabilota bacterium]|nr:hypothetical protein [Methylomirabilota bacterium]
MNRRSVIIGAAALAVAGIVGGLAHAADVAPFDSNAFRAAQDAGAGIVVFVHAPW